MEASKKIVDLYNNKSDYYKNLMSGLKSEKIKEELSNNKVLTTQSLLHSLNYIDPKNVFKEDLELIMKENNKLYKSIELELMLEDNKWSYLTNKKVSAIGKIFKKFFKIGDRYDTVSLENEEVRRKYTSFLFKLKQGRSHNALLSVDDNSLSNNILHSTVYPSMGYEISVNSMYSYRDNIEAITAIERINKKHP